MKILITGGTGTLGEALLKEFCDKENKIIFTYNSNKEKAIEFGGKYNAMAIHTNDLKNINYDFDIIINNAGISGDVMELSKLKTESWNEVFDVNVTLPFDIIKRNIEYMKNKGYGRIINISSIYAIKAEEELSAFNSSKCALIGLTKSVTKEYAKYGITCNVILPGTLESNVTEKIAALYSSDEERNNYYYELTKNIPAKRLGKPDEVAKLVKFISSDEASYINGATITIDGGYSV